MSACQAEELEPWLPAENALLKVFLPIALFYLQSLHSSCFHSPSIERPEIHSEMLSSGQPTARFPSLMGLGNAPSAIIEYSVERDSPVTRSTSFLLMIRIANLHMKTKKAALPSSKRDQQDGLPSPHRAEDLFALSQTDRPLEIRSSSGRTVPRINIQC